MPPSNDTKLGAERCCDPFSMLYLVRGPATAKANIIDEAAGGYRIPRDSENPKRSKQRDMTSSVMIHAANA
jgi:hypothetical protein